jgi:adenylate cyclase
MSRKLAAILSADAKGYSRLMADDEEATVRTITAYRRVISQQVEQHRGRVVDSPGDNVLAEFVSAVDAVKCAGEIQRELKAHNATLPEKRRMLFRIGINLGDVIAEKGRLYGSGVNIAARIEGLADPGGVSVSHGIFEQVKDKLELGFEDQGLHQVKNIAESVRVYRVLPEPAVGDTGRPGTHRAVWTLLVPLLLLAAGAWGLWHFHLGPGVAEKASTAKMAYPLPTKPSIAVLPFNNLSGDPDQDYLADGITENIITALSYIPEIFVIARNSSFAYKGKAVKTQKVAKDLGVRYILEGSVQRSGDRVRITAQLIDAASGRHLWADRYDRDLQDLFALQDEITLKIVLALQVKLSVGLQTRLVSKTMPNFEAWSYYVRGYGHMMHHTKADNARARELFKRAVSLAPEYAPGINALGWTYWEDAFHGWSMSRKESLLRAVELAKKALALDDSDPMIHALWGAIYLTQKQYDQAIAEGEKSVALGPNQPFPHLLLSMYLLHTGRYKEALPLVKKAMRLNPYYPPTYLAVLASIYLQMKDYEKAAEVYKMMVFREPHRIEGHRGLAVAYTRLGRKEQARSEAAEILRLSPEFSLDAFKKQLQSMDMAPAEVESLIGALREAGLK